MRSRGAPPPEFADSNVRFTTVNMPLVRTPMIAPTKLYDAFPALSPDEAAELVMKAVIEKPKRVATGLGLVGAVAQALTPGISEFVLNQAFRLFPDSLAAQGKNGETGETDAQDLAGNPGGRWRASCSRRCSAACTGSRRRKTNASTLAIAGFQALVRCRRAGTIRPSRKRRLPTPRRCHPASRSTRRSRRADRRKGTWLPGSKACRSARGSSC